MPEIYEIRVGEILEEKWAVYLSPFVLITTADHTLLKGVAHDQAELFGVLLKIRDLGIRLISVNPVVAE